MHSPVLAIIGMSVCHSLVLCQNDASYGHTSCTDGMG